MDFKCEHSLSKHIPFYLVPDPDNGHSVSSWIASTYAFTDAISFCEISTAEMMTVREMMVSESHFLGNSAIFCHALGIESGPCGFLTVLPMVEEGAQYVSIVHALRRCGNRSGVHSFILVIHNHQGYLQSSWNRRTVWKPIYDHPINLIVIVTGLIPSMILNPKIHYYQMRAQGSKEDLAV
jgi:hypothetical protein